MMMMTTKLPWRCLTCCLRAQDLMRELGVLSVLITMLTVPFSK